jgi:hypothetical protein
MKQSGFWFVLMTMMVVGLALASCGDSTDVCAAQKAAAAACSWLPAPLDACDDNLKACADGEREKWAEHFECMQSHCDAGEPEMVVQQVCGIELGGVSWDCSPGGSGI